MTGQLDLARQKVDQFLNDYFQRLSAQAPELLKPLYESMAYSALQNGKRIRPLLVLATARALTTPETSFVPFAAAVELIHTYSLIHDDLPAMDNDDFRRGVLTNHKKFGEAMAVLAGDGLQAQAFELIAESYKSKPAIAAELVALLAKACGPEGMVGGQALDILFRKNSDLKAQELEFLHSCKTGALISVSVMGAVRIAGAKQTQQGRLQEFSRKLGLAFQVADDVIDFAEQDQKIDGANFVSTLGLAKAQEFCQSLIEQAIETLSEFGEEAQWLRFLANDVWARAGRAVATAHRSVDRSSVSLSKTNAGELSGPY